MIHKQLRHQGVLVGSALVALTSVDAEAVNSQNHSTLISHYDLHYRLLLRVHAGTTSLILLQVSDTVECHWLNKAPWGDQLTCSILFLEAASRSRHGRWIVTSHPLGRSTQRPGLQTVCKFEADCRFSSEASVTGEDHSDKVQSGVASKGVNNRIEWLARRMQDCECPV